MLYTLTLNPSVDMNITTNALMVDATTKTREAVFTPSGKGLNVSFVLKAFGVPSTVLGFFGGFSGEHIIRSCYEADIPCKPVRIAGTTRVNVFLTDAEHEYKMVNEGPCITDEDQEAMLSLVQDLDDMDVLTVNGSTGRNVSLSFYERLLSIAKRKGADVILDISSPVLRDLLRFSPLLIKPNDEELQAIFGMRLTDEASAVSALRTLHDMGAQNVLLSMGKDGSYFYDGRHVYRCGVRQVKQRSSLCAGDGYLAAFLAHWLSDRSHIETALRYAAATGADVAASDGIGTLSHVEEYQREIDVKIIR